MLPAIFEHIPQGCQVMFEKLATAAMAGQPRQNAGIGRRVDHPVALRKACEIARGPQIAMRKFDAQPPQTQPIGFRAGADQIVDANDVDAVDALP